MSANKQREKIPVVIVEDHHEVVPHIHRDIGSKHLPLADITLVHFDSHPDMLIPVDMPAQTVFDKNHLYDSLSIENWILPLAYAGHVQDIYWLKPPWCQQIQDGHHTFHAGRCTNTGTIRTTCKESYFVSETLYVPESQLLDKKLISVTVVTVIPENWTDVTPKDQLQITSLGHHKDKVVSPDLPEYEEHKEDKDPICNPDVKKRKLDKDPSNQNDTIAQCRTSLYSILENLAIKLKSRHYILDIDLDFYSTKNPFQQMYSDKEMNLLRKLYQYTGPEDSTDQAIELCVKNRRKQLQQLKAVILTLSKDDTAKVDLDDERMNLARDLVSSLKSGKEDHDFEILHEAGCTMDDTDLPHHVSSEKQICALVQETKHILETLPKPTLITLSRSSVDDYCPPDQVDYIEEAVTLALQEVYVYTDVHRHYMDSEEDEQTDTRTGSESTELTVKDKLAESGE